MNLREAYELYKRTVSESYPIGLRFSHYLLELMKQVKPKRILDLGSGWSSYLLRLGCTEVWSADHDRAWLEKTRGFLRRFGMEDDRLIMIEDVSWDLQYDIILIDHGPSTRGRSLLFDRIKRCCTVAVVFDDAELQEYWASIRRSFEGWRIESLRKETIEKKHAKYAAIAWRI